MTDQLHETAHHADEYDAKIMEATKHAEYIGDQDGVVQDETYVAEYTEYDMTGVEGMEHHTDTGEQPVVYGGTSILATAQDNTDDQMIDDQHAGYYEQVDEGHVEGEKVMAVDDDGNQIMVDHIEQESEEHQQEQEQEQDHQEHGEEHDEHQGGQDHEHEHGHEHGGDHEHEHVHEHSDAEGDEHREHYGEQDEHQMYEAGQVVYSMMASDEAGANNSSSLDALSQAVTSSVSRYSNDFVSDKHGATQHDDDSSQDQGGHSHSSTPLSASITTPIKFKVPRVPEAGSHTPAKRPSSSRKDGANSRLKSRVWGWYDILADGQRQCKFCAQKYGRLTATTILARHYHSRHDPNPETMRHMATPTPRRSVSHGVAGSHQSTASVTPSHHHVQQHQQQHINISQAAAAAAAAVAAAVANGTAAPTDTSDAQASHLFHVQSSDGSTAEYQHQEAIGNGSTEDILRSVSEAVSQTAYDDNQIIMQDGFSTMMTAPLSRISLASAPRAVAA
ncbi:hypothetical protein LPJ57_007499, partial [Coemansia sp. RSA 486]